MTARLYHQLQALPDVSYDAAAKAQFRSLALRVLKDTARRLGLSRSDYDLCWNAGGIAVSGEATLHTDQLYIHISQSAFQPGRAVVMWRACEGRDDYCGRQNHFCKPIRLLELPTLIQLKAVLEAGFDDEKRLSVVML